VEITNALQLEAA